MSQYNSLLIPSGYMNVVNDPGIGQGTTVTVGTGVSPYAGQLGKWATIDAPKFSAAVGTVYGGIFQYVKLSSSIVDAIDQGGLVFWDRTAAQSAFQVTTDEAQGTDAAAEPAGIILSATVTAGNYTIIQISGLVYGQFRGTLTGTGTIGCAVYAAAAGTGADNGLLDVLSAATPTTFQDVALMQRRFLGRAFEVPTNGGLKRFYLDNTVKRLG